jgi:hypothetical protein
MGKSKLSIATAKAEAARKTNTIAKLVELAQED